MALGIRSGPSAPHDRRRSGAMARAAGQARRGVRGQRAGAGRVDQKAVKLARLPRVAFAVLAIFLLSGCASIQAYQEESKHWQEMADRATEKLGGGQVSVSVVAGHVRNSGSCAAGTITLGHDG